MSRMLPSLRRHDGAATAVVAVLITLLVSAASANAQVAQPTRDTATSDTARTRLEREKLELEIAKLRVETDNARRDLSSARGWINLAFSNLPVSLGLLLAFAGLIKYLNERKRERLRAEDERFEVAARGMGEPAVEARISSAAVLPTFLRPGYERFFDQVFNLAVASLRHSGPTRNEESTKPQDPAGAFRFLLVNVFKESFPRARDQLAVSSEKGEIESVVEQKLNASGTSLASAFLARADLRHAYLRAANLRSAVLKASRLDKVVLEDAVLDSADMSQAVIQGANLIKASLRGTKLGSADLSLSRADHAVFVRADLSNVRMHGGSFHGSDLTGADISGARFRDVLFEDVAGLDVKSGLVAKNAEFENVKGLTDLGIAALTQLGATVTSTTEPGPSVDAKA